MEKTKLKILRCCGRKREWCKGGGGYLMWRHLVAPFYREAGCASRSAGPPRSRGCGAHAPQVASPQGDPQPAKCSALRAPQYYGSFHFWTALRALWYQYLPERGYYFYRVHSRFLRASCGRPRFLFITYYLSRHDWQAESICVRQGILWVQQT